MAEEEVILEVHDDFYRDSFGRVIFIMIGLGVAISFVIASSIYLYLTKPPPITFAVDNQWHIQSAVPLTEPYLSLPDVLQWVSNSLPKAFTYDFVNYNNQLKSYMNYFTPNGWNVFLNQLNIYVNSDTVQSKKLFVTGNLNGAPFITNKGILSGRYAWWVQIPININYYGIKQSDLKSITLKVLLVRISNLDSISGVAIDDMLVIKTTDNTNTTNTNGLST